MVKYVCKACWMTSIFFWFALYLYLLYSPDDALMLSEISAPSTANTTDISIKVNDFFIRTL
jgi:hypothetical protein